MNTVIEYLYRDAGNYKVWNEAVIQGILSQQQIKTILSCLADGLWFIPRFVGLPGKQFDNWDVEADHPFFELGSDWIRTEAREPTVDITPRELTERFVANKDRWYR